MRDWLLDLRYAIRSVFRAPGHALTVAIVLGLAIAANAVAFSFVNTLFLRPPGVDRPTELVRVYTTYATGPRYFTLSYPDYADIARLTDVFAGVVADYPAPFSVAAGGANERLWGYLVSGNYFSVLGVHASTGRVFADDRDAREMGLPVVLSDACWRRRFGSDPAVLGRQVRINGLAAAILGIAPAGFTGVNAGIRPDLWIPVEVWALRTGRRDLIERRSARGYFVVGRLRPSVTIERARAATAVLERQLQSAFPASNSEITFSVLPEAKGSVHPMVRDGFVNFAAALWAAVTLILLLACASVTGLLVARAAGRSREIGVRLALGASRARIVRQLLTETSVLWALAGALGFAFAAFIVRWLASIQLPTDRPVFVDVSADVRVFGFAALATAATALVFGLTPAVAAARSAPADALRSGARAHSWRSPLRRLVVGGQVALCVTVLVLAGLCLRSLSAARHIDLGFDPRGLAIASIDPGTHGYDFESATRLVRNLRARLQSAPGIQAVGLAFRIPFEMNVIRTAVEPIRSGDSRSLPSVDFAVVDAGYFDAMRIPIVDGRAFSANDAPETAKVVVLNETLARRLWPGESAVGRRLRVAGVVRQVVGVVKDGKYLTLGEEPTSFVYLPFDQDGGTLMTVIVRAADPALALARVREEARALDPTLPLYNVRTMSDHLEIAAIPAGVTATLFGSFGVLALLMASVGLYGLLACSVAQRTREIGIRRALGASGSHIMTLVIAQALAPVAAGLLAGGALGALVARVLRGILYGVQPDDPAAYTAAATVLLLTAAAACAIPAHRAVRVEPMDALRHE